LFNTLAFTSVTVVFKTGLGLALAFLLNTRFPSRNVLRTLFFSTYTLSPLIIGIVFVSILSGHGPLNAILTSLGFESLTHFWLSEPNTALAATMAVEVWRMLGWNMIIFLAGLQMIPKDYYEAAEIDGASRWVQLRRITIPFLMPSIIVAVVLNTIHGLKVFEIVYALTGGGPGSLTEVINTQVFREFADGRYGMSNALAVVVFVLTLAIALGMRRWLSGEEVEK
jgi:raffinose/stachyose/melibiose transport system permease protein